VKCKMQLKFSVRRRVPAPEIGLCVPKVRVPMSRTMSYIDHITDVNWPVKFCILGANSMEQSDICSVWHPLTEHDSWNDEHQSEHFVLRCWSHPQMSWLTCLLILIDTRQWILLCENENEDNKADITVGRRLSDAFRIQQNYTASW